MPTTRPDPGESGRRRDTPHPRDVLARAKVTAGVRFNVRRRVTGAFDNLRAFGRQEELTPDDERAVVTAYLLLGCVARLPDLRSHPAPPAESLAPVT